MLHHVSALSTPASAAVHQATLLHPESERRLDCSVLGRLTALMFAPGKVRSPSRPASARASNHQPLRAIEREPPHDGGRTTAATPATSALPAMGCCELRIALTGSLPPVWRIVLVPSDLGLEELHAILLTVMGWTHSSRHEFRQGRRRFGSVPNAHDARGVTEDEFDFLIGDVLHRPRQRLYCTIDAGRVWDLTITLVAMRRGCSTGTVPCVIAGEHGCPMSGPGTQEGTLGGVKPSPPGCPLADINEALARGIDILLEDCARMRDAAADARS
jgi:hypothetical protein